MNMRLLTSMHQLSSRARLRFYRLICFTSVIVAVFSTGICMAQTEAVPETKAKGPMVRMFCVRSLTGDEEEAILATKTEDGNWIEHGPVTLRTPFITEWFRVSGGMTHLIRKVGKEFKSFGSFSISPQAERSLVILVPDAKKNIYRAQVIDPGNLGFKKGKALVINYGEIPAMVKIANQALTVLPGKKIVTGIDADADGMFRLMIGHQDKDKNTVLCYDKSLSSNPQARKFILLFPDRKSGLRAMTLSEFGPFE